jgi:dihydroorotate dehydrogenase
MLYRVLRPLLFRVDAEEAHEQVTALLRAAASTRPAARVLRAAFAYEDPILETTVAGLRFANPLGLAAGFDKGGTLVGAMGLLGFGHVEVGTVTPRPQPGNPRPRLFRLPEDEALVNRMGFNSPGAAAVAERLRSAPRAAKDEAVPVIGVNLGKNRDTPLDRAADDYLAAFVGLAPLADYVAVNISSPNTPGLRSLQDAAVVRALLGGLVDANRTLPRQRPIFIKISPDETEAQVEAVVAAGAEAGAAGFIATNTTLERAGVRGRRAGEAGGLSGVPLAHRARQVVAQVYRLTGGALPVIGVGGVRDAESAYALVCAGASLVQLYTGLVYGGPALPAAIMRGLVGLLRRDGYRSVQDAVGASARS